MKIDLSSFDSLFKKMVDDVWRLHVDGCKMFQVLKKQKSLKPILHEDIPLNHKPLNLQTKTLNRKLENLIMR